ncbi:hypothetical protein MSTO_32020 [Mycobacterium stomatepiae]|uniref:PPE domain-containing protein n=2 Tax=Mycobacterium stomatepiae TaxID=470076 RepID=A0A7I7QAB2_9MYCO|nr:hypothetical protein MSTO_32020 [Mycobacterium stomatepiae]
MLAVATQYVSWLKAAAAQAEATSSQASAIAGAFETALSATVQPAVVNANRALVRALASQNHLGQNAPTIMDIESAYEQMWATDVAAMSGYHADASAAAEQMAPWQNVMQNLGMQFNNGDLIFGPHSGTGNLAHHINTLANLDHTGSHVGSWLTDAPGTGFAHAVTSGPSSADLSASLLNSPTAGTGFNPGTANLGLLNNLGSGTIPTGLTAD